MSEERVVNAWQNLIDKKQTVNKYRNALAGDGAGVVDVDGEPGYIWCRYSADQSKVSKVFSMERGIPEDFPIQVGRRSPDDEFEQVLWIDWTQYQDIVTDETVENFNTSNHGESHNAASGADPAPIDLRNIIEMRGRAQETADLTIKIERGQYEFGDEVKRYPGEDVDLTASVPGVAGHRFVLVYVDGTTNAADFDNGVIVPLAAAAPIPDLTVSTLPICLVDLQNGQTTITEDSIYDWRFLWKMVSNLAPIFVGTNAERLVLVLANLAELTRFYTTDTDKIWEVWEAAWRLIYPPPALSDSAGNTGTPWATDASGNLIGDDGAGDSPQVQLVGGSNDDTADIFLDDSAVAGQSDLAINLPGTDANSVLNIRDSGGVDKMHVDAEGSTFQYVWDAVTNTYSTWQTLEHASTGAVANGFAGRLSYRLENTGAPSSMQDAAAIQIEWEDSADASEDTIIRFYGRKAGAALGEFVHFGATEAVFNEDSADIDFRVESNGDVNMLVVNGGLNRVGVGIAAPAERLHVYGAGTVLTEVESSGAGQIVGLRFTDTGQSWDFRKLASDVCSIVDTTGGTLPFKIEPTTPTDSLYLDSTGRIGIAINAPVAQLHVDQSSTTAAIPTLYLDQADVSEEMIEFNTTIGVGNAIEAIGGKTLTTTHFIKVTLPGALTRYIPCGTIA